MPPGQDGNASDAYRPTSIDFINLPNPIEPSQPQAGSQKHPLNGTPHLEKARLEQSSNSDLFKLILDPSSERPHKRQKGVEDSTLDLPRLPVRKHATQRVRIPPTLSGLHQPPPNAGLLPSISVEQPKSPPPRKTDAAVASAPARPAERKNVPREAEAAKSDNVPPPPPPKARQRRKWSQQETEHLLKGVAMFGIGSWTKILNCPDFKFDNRTALDLKDRFRVCCPSSYKSLKPSKSTSSRADVPQDQHAPSAKHKKTTAKGPPREEISPSRLQQMGINEPFVNVGRRNRHEYTVAEDEALLQGFKKHGNVWSKIQKDAELGLSGRRAADLRDRFRGRYPAEYAKSVPKSSVAKRAIEDNIEKASGSESEVLSEAPRRTMLEKEEATISKTAPAKRPPLLPLFSLDDVFLGRSYGDDDENGEPIVLDRGILDWAGADAGRTSGVEASKSTGIDPLMTLKLPKPLSNNVLTAIPSAPTSSQNNSNSLPSLASVLPETAYHDQIELPSLIQMIGSLENDGKTGGGNFPSLEDLLS